MIPSSRNTQPFLNSSIEPLQITTEIKELEKCSRTDPAESRMRKTESLKQGAARKAGLREGPCEPPLGNYPCPSRTPGNTASREGACRYKLFHQCWMARSHRPQRTLLKGLHQAAFPGGHLCTPLHGTSRMSAAHSP